jgi:hypothetical protein
MRQSGQKTQQPGGRVKSLGRFKLRPLWREISASPKMRTLGAESQEFGELRSTRTHGAARPQIPAEGHGSRGRSEMTIQSTQGRLN